MEAKIRAMCAAQVPGDTHRNLTVRSEYSGQTFKHVLVPVWLLTYGYGRKNYQVVMNGFTGAIAGDRPYSAAKITLLILFIMVIAAVVLLVANQ